VDRITPIALLLLAACGTTWEGEADIHGMHLVVDSTAAAFQDSPELRMEIRDVVQAGALAWGHSPSDLAGWRLRIKDGLVWCGGDHGAGGCTDEDNRTITVTTTNSHDFAHSVFMHEMLHVFLKGDGDHSGKEWWECSTWVTLWFWANASDEFAVSYSGAWVGSGWQGIPYCAPRPFMHDDPDDPTRGAGDPGRGAD
jgi:hypothetical protein